MEIPQSMNILILYSSNSQITLLKRQGAAQTPNVQITCRGEDSPSVSNTQPGKESPEKAGGFRGKIDIEFQDILNPIIYFSSD